MTQLIAKMETEVTEGLEDCVFKAYDASKEHNGIAVQFDYSDMTVTVQRKKPPIKNEPYNPPKK